MRAGWKTLLGTAVLVSMLATSGGSSIFAQTASGVTAAGQGAGAALEQQTANAHEPQAGTKPAAQVRKLSLEEALKLADENNINLKRLKIAYDNAMIENEKAYNTARKIYQVDKNNPYYDMNLDAYLARDVNPRARQLGEEKAQRSYRAGRELVLLGVRKKYYDVLKARDTLNSKQAAVERARLQLKNAEAAYKAGTVAKTDLLQAQVGLYSAQAEHTVARNNYQKAMIDLNKDIGLDPATILELTTAVSQDAAPANGDLDYAAMLSQRLDVLNARADLEIARITYEAIQGYTAANTYAARQARLDLQDKEEKLQDLQRSAQGEIQKAYMDMNAALEGLKALDKAVELARENHRLAEMRYKVGVATSLDVITASENLASTEARRISALYDYNLAKLQCEVVKVTALTLGN